MEGNLEKHGGHGIDLNLSENPIKSSLLFKKTESFLNETLYLLFSPVWGRGGGWGRPVAVQGINYCPLILFFFWWWDLGK